jgi:hypothetical protein
LTWILCSYVYWPAQNIMAHSMFYINDKKWDFRMNYELH